MKLHLTFPNAEEKSLTPHQWDDKDFILDGDTWDYICENLDGHIFNNTLREGYAVDHNTFWHIRFGSRIENWIYFETSNKTTPTQIEQIVYNLRHLNDDRSIHHVSVHYEDNCTIIVAKYYWKDEE